jgi:hypothetical protein
MSLDASHGSRTHRYACCGEGERWLLKRRRLRERREPCCRSSSRRLSGAQSRQSHPELLRRRHQPPPAPHAVKSARSRPATATTCVHDGSLCCCNPTNYPAGIVPSPKSLSSAGEPGAPLSETKELLHKLLSGATPEVENGEACMRGLPPQETLRWTPETTPACAPTPPPCPTSRMSSWVCVGTFLRCSARAPCCPCFGAGAHCRCKCAGLVREELMRVRSQEVSRAHAPTCINWYLEASRIKPILLTETLTSLVMPPRAGCHPCRRQMGHLCL